MPICSSSAAARRARCCAASWRKGGPCVSICFRPHCRLCVRHRVHSCRLAAYRHGGAQSCAAWAFRGVSHGWCSISMSCGRRFREPLPRGGCNARRYGARYSFGTRVAVLRAPMPYSRPILYFLYPLPKVMAACSSCWPWRRAEDRAHRDYRVLPSARNRARCIEERA